MKSHDIFSTAKRSAVLMASTLFVCGCSTAPPALQLASQGAVGTETAQQELTAFVKRAEQIYAAREAIVINQAKSDIADQLNKNFGDFIAGKAGQPTFDANVQLITSIADAKKTLREQIVSDTAAKTADIKKAFGEPTKIPAEKLAAARKAFVVLSQELSHQEWLELSWKYAKDLQADIKEARKQVEEAK
jgi:hypothetical protein